MLSKANIAAAAALLVASVAPAGAYAQSFGGAYLMPELQLYMQSKHVKARAPSNARASAEDFRGFLAPDRNSRGRWFETDPDPRIRFEMNRDDRDRRAG